MFRIAIQLAGLFSLSWIFVAAQFFGPYISQASRGWAYSSRVAGLHWVIISELSRRIISDTPVVSLYRCKEMLKALHIVFEIGLSRNELWNSQIKLAMGGKLILELDLRVLLQSGYVGDNFDVCCMCCKCVALIHERLSFLVLGLCLLRVMFASRRGLLLYDPA
ncbi:hypothetical protein B0H17DRAFT_1148759 [Mycena rosella]|uniref:Uncharacterized protein n=1 Tax=Mycena rosella TaxID=1033263 RepID=A0AAD7C995_MYCRO|nr:hypothetical protein B0H17DRAFT_1148759 [Mycena rosella]